MKLVVLIPAFNEEITIGKAIELIPRQIPGIAQVQVIVIDDGSADRTSEIANQKGAIVIRHAINMGVGATFSTGILAALHEKPDIIVHMDADMQFNPLDIPQLIKPILEKKASFVTASRFLKKEYIPLMSLSKRFGNIIVAGIINYITKQHFTDVSCGFRAFSFDTALRINLFGDFTYTQEIFIDLLNKKVPIQEVALKIKGQREFGKSRVAKNVVAYGIRSLMIMLRAMRDVNPLKFFGGIGLSILTIGTIFELFVFTHWLIAHRTSPFTSFVMVGGIFLILGFLQILLALIADMLGRIKRIQEENLYYNKKIFFDNDKDKKV
ncbi:MAG: glycosyltransferase family 2 protein [Patescibacteria group bacterium]|nr:glycosyltransferase family 2 protein [Patescibacteria group bacterium]MDD5715147.1 glycosyltransferase family 2 protein [Patescibacteria group bacterium]